jgi:hypothetical protein
MKAELEELEKDFSKENLDELVKKNYEVVNENMKVQSEVVVNIQNAIDSEIQNQENKEANVMTDEEKLLKVPSQDCDSESSKSDSSILYGKEYLNTSQNTIASKVNTSLFSTDHYQHADPENECVS